MGIAIFSPMTAINLPPKLSNESEKDYQIFLSYCLLGGDHSISKLAKKSVGKAGGSEKRLYELSSQFQWCDQVKNYDAAIAEFTGEVLAEQVGKDVVIL